MENVQQQDTTAVSPFLPAVARVTREQLGLDFDYELTEKTEFVDGLGCDSLDCVELVMAIEEEYNIEILDEDADNWRTLGDVCQYLQGLGITPESCSH